METTINTLKAEVTSLAESIERLSADSGSADGLENEAVASASEDPENESGMPQDPAPVSEGVGSESKAAGNESQQVSGEPAELQNCSASATAPDDVDSEPETAGNENQEVSDELAELQLPRESKAAELKPC